MRRRSENGRKQKDVLVTIIQASPPRITLNLKIEIPNSVFPQPTTQGDASMGDPMILQFPRPYETVSVEPFLSPPPLSPPVSSTVRDVYEQFVRPDDVATKSAATVSADRTHIKHFEAACTHIFDEINRLGEYRTQSPVLPLGDAISSPNPPINEINEDLLIAVRNWILTVKKRSNNTCRKVLTTICKVLRAASKRKLISEIPDMPKIPKTHSTPLPVEMDEVAALYEACDVAQWPRLGKIPPPQTWRCLLVLFWTYGARTQDFFGYKTTCDDGLRKSELTFNERCPNPNLRRFSSPHGWLNWLPDKTQNTRGEMLALPLSKIARNHIEPFTRIDQPRIFSNGRSKDSYLKTWHTIRKVAGVTDDASIANTGTRNGKITRSIRKGCSNNWDDARDGLGEWVLGQTPQGTNAKHYKNILPRVINLIDNIAVPDCFREIQK